ncbi:MAG: glycosyltransferase family 4 protein [Ferruginibacter sp.]|nr:glycosyltransferase family 4 protein [Ferruginibacter sp.]
MQNIIFDCERMKYEDTGIYHYCYNLGLHLQQFANPFQETITYYTPFGINEIFEHSHHCIPQIELHKFFMPSLKNYNIWHATYQDSYYIPFRNKNIKVVLTIHDLNFIYDSTKAEYKKQRNLRRLQSLINRADVIICISEYCKKDVQFYCDVKNKPIHVIYNGTNRLELPSLTKKSYKPLRKFIFTLGTIVRKKNFHSLLPLVKNKELELIIAGRLDDVDYCHQIKDTANAMNINEQVHLIGQVSEHEKAWYFNNCSAFAFPSMAEGFGLPVAEAMSLGKPIFLSNKTALPEIGGNVAFYFKDFAAAAMTATFEEGMKQYYKFNMRHDIMEKGKQFCWNNAAKEYWNVYRSLY